MKNRIPFLDFLRVIAIAMVMVIHVCECFYFNAEGELHIASQGDAVWVSIIDSSCRAAVPLFVIASGYLLFPLQKATGEFFRRRLTRVLVPFAVWCAIYLAVNHGNWLGIVFNFPIDVGGHLWFVPMLIGLYLLMPLLSPWAERSSKKEIQLYLGIWLFTTLFPFLRKLSLAVCGAGADGGAAYLYGEAPWNAFGTFQYVAGFFGYMLLGFYFKRFVGDFSWRKTLLTAIPMFILGLAIVGGVFYLRIPGIGAYPVTRPYSAAVDLEMSWEYCSLGVAFLTAAYFLVIRKLNFEGAVYRRIISPIANASFGVYLSHMLILPPMVALMRPHLATPLCIFAAALATLLAAALAISILRCLPFVGKWICG